MSPKNSSLSLEVGAKLGFSLIQELWTRACFRRDRSLKKTPRVCCKTDKWILPSESASKDSKGNTQGVCCAHGKEIKIKEGAVCCGANYESLYDEEIYKKACIIEDVYGCGCKRSVASGRSAKCSSNVKIKPQYEIKKEMILSAQLK